MHREFAMSRTLFIVVALFAFTKIAGCASSKSEMERELDDLWRGGYGFNNPNPERIQQGKEPLNFDGSKPNPWWMDW